MNNDTNHRAAGLNGEARADRAKRPSVQKSDTEAFDSGRDPLEELAAEYAQRIRDGERVSIDDYAAQYPQLAEQIRDLFPAVSAIEQLNTKRAASSSLSANPTAVEQLGDYRILGEIARGGMGVIYEAEQITLGRRVAVKVLPRHALRGPRDIQRFEREAQTAANLHHTNIVPVFGVGEQDGTHYIVMQLIQGVGLDEIFDELRRSVTGRLPDGSQAGPRTSRSSCIERSAVTLLQDTLRRNSSTTSARRLATESLSSTTNDAVAETPANSPTPQQIRTHVPAEYYRNIGKIGQQAAQALAYAHQHATLHRDVKPGNLLLDDEGVVWMADFGLAKAVENDDVTWTGDVVGTIGYMAPERFDGIATASSDVYSLGLTLYELLSLRRVYDGSDRLATMRRVTNENLPELRKLNPDVPVDLQTIVAKAAARNPQDRYHSASELGDDLTAFLSDRPISARRIGPMEHFTRWCRRNPAVASLAASVLFLLVAVLGVTMGGYVHVTSQKRQVEATSRLAVGALDEIYGQLAPAQLRIPSASASADDEEDVQHALLAANHPPVSKDVALLLDNLLRFYDELSQQSVDVPGLAEKSIVANRKVGDIRRRLGEFDAAQIAYNEAITRIEDLDPGLRAASAVRLEYARCQNGRGIVLNELGSPNASQAHRIAIDQVESSADEPGARFELARSLYLLYLSQRHDKGYDRNAELANDANLEQAVETLRQLRAAYPDVPEYKVLLAHCFLAFRVGCNSAGELSRFQTQAIELLDELHQAAPDVAVYQFELADAYRAIEWRELWRSRHQKRPVDELINSERRLRRALEVSQNLEIRHPDIPQYHVLKKSLHHILAIVLTDQNRLAEAEVHFQKAIECQRAVVANSREPLFQKIWLLQVQLNYAQLLRDLDRIPEAHEHLDQIVMEYEALLTQTELLRNSSYTRRAQKYLSQAYATFAGVLNQLGDEDRAKLVLRKAEKCDS